MKKNIILLVSFFLLGSIELAFSENHPKRQHKNDQAQTAESENEAGVRLSYHEYVTPEMIIIFKDNSP